MSPPRPLSLTHTHHNSSTQKIPQAKQDIYSFSIEIVDDINHLAEVFGESRETGGQLSQKAQEDLKETRDLVNEICKWAHEGLVSLVFREQNRVVPDIHSKQVEKKLGITLTAEEKMKELKDKLMDVRNKFMVRFLCLDKII